MADTYELDVDESFRGPGSVCPETKLEITKGAYKPGDDGRLTLNEPHDPGPAPIPPLPRPCWFQPRTWESTHWVIGEWESGTLHAWGTDFEEFEAGPALFPIGVIADERGAVHSVCVDRIRLEI